MPTQQQLDNEAYCGCTGIFIQDPSDPDVGTCAAPTGGEDPCPHVQQGFWQTAASWDWNNISTTALTWGYATGLLKPPSSNLETQAYMMELQKQRQQMNMILIGLGVLMLVVIIVLVRKK